MADWKTVRFDPNYVEPLDPEVVPLCDALNAAGFVTTASCSGHGNGWPHVWFEHSSDERIERLIRFVKQAEEGDFRPHFTMWRKEVLFDGYVWSVQVHLNGVYHDTPREKALLAAGAALACTTRLIEEWKQLADG